MTVTQLQACFRFQMTEEYYGIVSGLVHFSHTTHDWISFLLCLLGGMLVCFVSAAEHVEHTNGCLLPGGLKFRALTLAGVTFKSFFRKVIDDIRGLPFCD